MRELRLLTVVALAVVLGMALGLVQSRLAPRPVNGAAAIARSATEPLAVAGKSVVTRIVGALNGGDAEPFPVSVANTWRPGEKEAMQERVARLSKSDADYLCLTLGLIPEEEVFDKVNVTGRLIRYVNGLSGPSELRDLDTAFRQLASR